MTKGMTAMLVYTTKECSYNSIVIVHQHGGYDVTCKPRIRVPQRSVDFFSSLVSCISLSYAAGRVL